MSCWVVPAIAAEFLGIPVPAVLEAARAGKLPSKTELGFTLIDVAPHSPRAQTGFRPPAAPPPTYTPAASDELTDDERLALEIEEPAEGELAGMAEEDDCGDEERFDWRQARQAASRHRRSPRRFHAAA